MKKLFTLALVFYCSISYSGPLMPVSQPVLKFTPGVLCSQSDRDFSEIVYPEKISRCQRNIGDEEKTAVAANYGNIPRSEWNNYEFDHLFPVCAGGSNSPENLWPQPLTEAKKKDILEVDICLAMKAGTLKQSEAVKKIQDWFSQTH